MKTLMKEFIYYLQYIDPKSDLTVKSYQNDIKAYFDFLESKNITDIKAVDYQTITEYIVSLKNDFEPSTIRHRVVCLRQFHQYCLRMKLTPTDPSSFVAIKNTGTRLPSSLNQDALRKLLSFPLETPKDVLDQTLLRLLYRCGLRVSECVNLTFSQIHMDEQWLRILGKGRKERLVPVSSDAMALLNQYLDTVRPLWLKSRTDLVFLNSRGNAITRQYVHTMIKSRCKVLGIDSSVSAHTLRHSFASDLLAQDTDLRVIQELLGHADIATTQIYTHVNHDTLKQEYDKYLMGGFANKGGLDDEEI